MEIIVRLALLEDDSAIRAQVEDLVSQAGHHLRSFSTSRALTVSLRQESYDLLLLDWNMPDFSGIQLLEWARQNLASCPPVMMVTSRTEPQDIVAALEAGADDYIVKPFDPSVFLARLNALLRRSYPADAPASGQEELFGVIFDHAKGTVTINGAANVVTTKEFRLALTFFRNLNRPMSRTHLLEAVWGRNPDLPTRTLDVHVSRLRSRLGLRPENGFRLTPVHSFGYRLEMISPSLDAGSAQCAAS